MAPPALSEAPGARRIEVNIMNLQRAPIFRAAALTLALAMAIPAAAQAGRGGYGGGYRGGYGGGYRGGYGGYGGYRGGYYGGYRGGYYGGYRGGYYGGYRGGYYGYNRGLYGYGLGIGYGYPYYGVGLGVDYTPYYGTGLDYGYSGYSAYTPPSLSTFDSPALVTTPSSPPADYQRMYPSNLETAPPPGEADRALVTVRVPADAKLYFQGQEMTLTGTERVFRTPSLQPGKNYRYDVTARWMANGKPVEQSRSITVQAGKPVSLDLMAGN
jgi:uncharacterized protein (TIGR03000 family)